MTRLMNLLLHLQRNKILIDCILQVTSAVVPKGYSRFVHVLLPCRRLKGVLILADYLIGQGGYYFLWGTKFVVGGGYYCTYYYANQDSILGAGEDRTMARHKPSFSQTTFCPCPGRVPCACVCIPSQIHCWGLGCQCLATRLKRVNAGSTLAKKTCVSIPSGPGSVLKNCVFDPF